MPQGHKAKVAKQPDPLRLGPRPLPLHLLLALSTWANSRLASPLWKNGSLPWRPELAVSAAQLGRSLANVPLEDFTTVLDRVIQARLSALAAGILAYRHHPYRRSLVDPPEIWRAGSTRLLDYGGDGAPVLVVPSLINRAYVLDLGQDRSLLRFLAGAGLRPLLVDWGAPGTEERGFDLDDYIAGRLEAAFDVARDIAGGPILVLGYCMGGLLALAVAIRRRAEVAGLALMATPWDFHADDPVQAKATAAIAEPLLPAFDRLGEMPVDMLQAMFVALDPFLAIRKFTTFGNLDPDSEKAREFVALEDWVNDGVPLAPKVARECLLGWYRDNLPARGGWHVAGAPVIPEELDRPALVLIPEHDRIVPPASALALAEALPGAERLRPEAGHIGMVVGSGAKMRAWTPLAEWLTKQALR